MRTLSFVCGLGLIVACGGTKDSGPPAADRPGPRLQLVYDLDVDAAIDDRIEELRRDLESGLAEDQIAASVTVSGSAPDTLMVTPRDPATRPAIDKRVTADYADTVERRACAAGADPGAICLGLAATYADAIRKAALRTAVETVRDRLVARKLTKATVVERAGQIVVELRAGGADEVDQLRSLIARGGRLELKAVDDGSAYMRQLFAHVGSAGPDGEPTDPPAIEAGISTGIDQWQPETGGPPHTDYYLVAYDREAVVSVDEARRLGCLGDVVQGKARCRVTGRAAIEQYLAELGATDARFRVPDDREIGYEYDEPALDAPDPRPSWRTYYLERAVGLTGAAITNAQTVFDPNTNHPLVLIELGRAGARTFGELTARIVGKKLATILDDRIMSAPIINDPIRGGRASIAMGGNDPRRQEAEARELVDVLKSGSLPAPLRLASETVVP